MINPLTFRNKFSLAALLLAVFTNYSCTDTPPKSNTDTSQTAQSSAVSNVDTAPQYSERERLIKALQQLQQDISSKNPKAIAAYFRFPIASDDLQVFDIGEDFDKAVKQSNYQVSQALFLSHFNALYENLEMQGLADMFQHITLSQLQDTATKKIKKSRPDGVCTYLYNITIEGKEVTLQYGVNTNDEYLKKHPQAETECPEYAAFWTFVFDGEKLLFSRHQVAG